MTDTFVIKNHKTTKQILMKKITISIVEDEKDFEDVIKKKIASSPTLECISTYRTGEEALEQIPKKKLPDVVLMDINLKGSKISGIDCMMSLKVQFPAIRFLVISKIIDQEVIFAALKVGAGAYISKKEIPKKLDDVIIEFYQGGAPMSPIIARLIVKELNKSAEELALLATMKQREKLVLDLIAKGKYYKEVADELNIKESSVKGDCNSIYKKLHVNNAIEALRKYLNKL